MGTTTASLTLRKLGDITGDGSVGLDDKLQMNKRLNGLPTPGYELRHFDLNGSGTVGLDDKVILNQVLNNLPIRWSQGTDAVPACPGGPGQRPGTPTHSLSLPVRARCTARASRE